MKRLSEAQMKRLSLDDRFRYADMLCERLDILSHGSAEDLKRIDKKIKRFLKEKTA